MEHMRPDRIPEKMDKQSDLKKLKNLKSTLANLKFAIKLQTCSMIRTIKAHFFSVIQKSSLEDCFLKLCNVTATIKDTAHPTHRFELRRKNA